MKFETDKKLTQICEYPAQFFSCKSTLAVTTAKTNQGAIQMQIKVKWKIYNPLKREPLSSAQIQHSRPELLSKHLEGKNWNRAELCKLLSPKHQVNTQQFTL